MAIRKLWLCRHGETIHNLEGRIQGELDSDLTVEGLRQADALGLFLKQNGDCSSPRLLFSPLRRTALTAELIAKAINAPAEAADELKELRRGILEGRLKAELSRSELHHYRSFETDPWTYRVPGGETFTDLQMRIRAFIERELRSITAPEACVLVSHGYVIRMLISELTGMNVNDLSAPHGIVHHLRLFNDIQYDRVSVDDAVGAR